MTAPDVTIVIPCRDASRTIDATIDSCARQTGVSMEIILVDDRCQDDTIARGRTKAAKHGLPFTATQAPTPGPGPARNAGYRLAQGRHLLWLDADDELLQGALSHHLATLAKHGSSPAMSSGDMLMRDDDGPGGPVVRAIPQVPHPDALTALLRGKFWVPPGAILFNRAASDRLMEAGGFSAAVRMQDREAFARALMAGISHHHTNRLVLCYRLSAGQLSRKWPRYRYAAVLKDMWRGLRDFASRWRFDLSLEQAQLLDADFRLWYWTGGPLPRGLAPQTLRDRAGRTIPLNPWQQMMCIAGSLIGEPFYADMLVTLATSMYPHAESDHLALRDALASLVSAGAVKRWPGEKTGLRGSG